MSVPTNAVDHLAHAPAPRPISLPPATDPALSSNNPQLLRSLLEALLSCDQRAEQRDQRAAERSNDILEALANVSVRVGHLQCSVNTLKKRAAKRAAALANAVSNLEDNLDNLCNVICDAQNGTLHEPDDNGVYGDVCHSRDDTDYATNSDA